MDNNINGNTPDIGELISKLTSDPAMMQQISKIAESFKNTSSTPNSVGFDEEGVETSARPNLNESHFSMEHHTHLFNALKPYLNDERKVTLDYIIQLFSVIKLLEMSGINLNNIIPAFNIPFHHNEISEE